MGVLKISDKTLGEVEALAKAGAVPVDQQAELLIREALERRKERERLLRRLDDIAAMTPKDVVQTDSAILVREDRDR